MFVWYLLSLFVFSRGKLNISTTHGNGVSFLQALKERKKNKYSIQIFQSIFRGNRFYSFYSASRFNGNGFIKLIELFRMNKVESCFLNWFGSVLSHIISIENSCRSFNKRLRTDRAHSSCGSNGIGSSSSSSSSSIDFFYISASNWLRR